MGAHLLPGAKGCSEDAWWGSVHRVHSYLNGVVTEIRWVERLSEWNHVPHFLYFVTHYVDSMPIAWKRGILCDVLFNLKYAGCIYKVTVAIDTLGNIVWICPLAPGHRRMFSFGIVRGPKGQRDIIWIMRLAPWMVHARGASMWYGPVLVERL